LEIFRINNNGGGETHPRNRKEIIMKQSKVLQKLADTDIRIESYHFMVDGQHCLLLNDGFELEYGGETILEYTVKEILEKLQDIARAEGKS